MSRALLLLALLSADGAAAFGTAMASSRGSATLVRRSASGLALLTPPAPPAAAAAVRVSTAPLMMAEKELNPVAVGAVGGGALGIFSAAYCTSSGSPPTGLLVAFFSVLFMSAGATIVESGGLPPRE